jgi:hypothetical protein
MITLASLPLLFASIVAPLGALDIGWFHMHKFRLYDQPSARFETLTHLARGVLFAAGALILTRYRPMGTWFWVTVALFVADFLNTVLDVLSEEKSRAPLGGLPQLEYFIHIVGATFEGGIALAFVTTSWGNAAEPTALEAATNVPSWLTLLGMAGAAGGLSFTLLEATLYVRSIVRTGWAPQDVPSPSGATT